jgi:hypothetical protein
MGLSSIQQQQNGGRGINAGEFLRSQLLWEIPMTEYTNSSGFNGLPGGAYTIHGHWYIWGQAYWWTNSTFGSNALWFRRIAGSDIYRGAAGSLMNGMNIRCLKD